jgi:hypothetical protein
MGAKGTRTGKSAEQRRDDFAKKNAAWDQRVKGAVSELDRIAQKAKGAATLRRRRTSA